MCKKFPSSDLEVITLPRNNKLMINRKLPLLGKAKTFRLNSNPINPKRSIANRFWTGVIIFNLAKEFNQRLKMHILLPFHKFHKKLIIKKGSVKIKAKYNIFQAKLLKRTNQQSVILFVIPRDMRFLILNRNLVCSLPTQN